MREPSPSLRSMTDIDGFEYYRQRAEEHKNNEQALGGMIVGSVATFVALVIWEVIRR